MGGRLTKNTRTYILYKIWMFMDFEWFSVDVQWTSPVYMGDVEPLDESFQYERY